MFKIDLIQELEKELAKTKTQGDELLKQANELINKKSDLINEIFPSLHKEREDFINKKNLKEKFKEYPEDKIFLQKNIKKICEKYNLRCLPTYLYKGTLGEFTADKIEKFEKRMLSEHRIKINKKRFFIIAPASEFKLTERPRDPILIYSVNDAYLREDSLSNINIIIDKWGNDLTIINRFKGMFFKNWFITIGLFLILLTNIINPPYWGFNFIILMPYIIIVSLIGFVNDLEPYEVFKSRWDSEYL